MRAEHSKTRPALAEYRLGSGHGLGRAGIKNGQLLKLVADEFDVFITSDKNLRYQQNLAEINTAVLLLPSNQVPVITNLLPQIDEALSTIEAYGFVEL